MALMLANTQPFLKERMGVNVQKEGRVGCHMVFKPDQRLHLGAEAEQAEIDILSDFLPEQLNEEELEALIVAAIADSGAESMADMGKVMAQLKPKVQGRADMKQVSAAVRSKLG